MKRIYQSILIIVILLVASCKKYVETGPPPTQMATSTVFKNDGTAIAAQLAIYAQMETESFLSHLTTYTAFSGDEAISYATTTMDLFNNGLIAENSLMYDLWSRIYKYIYQANAILEALDASTGVSPNIRKQLSGESKFIRAFCYFYLVNLFGDTPLVLTTDYQVNAVLPRADKLAVYAQIVKDLSEAKQLLPSGYVDAVNNTSTERVRPNKWSAVALLSRTYLFMQEWAKAAAESTELIDGGGYTLTSNLNNIFLKNSTESIWQIMTIPPRMNTFIGNSLILTATPTSNSMTTGLYNAFEPTDTRKAIYAKSLVASGQTYYYAYKYKANGTATTSTEYTMMLRLSEQFLIRAEARARLNDIPGAQADLNRIRNRASLANTIANTTPTLISAIIQERRIELLFEFGHRWLDLKRSGLANAVLAPVKGTNWNTEDQLYPIPQTEILRNRLLTQNPGY